MVAAAKFWIAATKILFVVPNFVAVTKPLFPSLHLNIAIRIIIKNGTDKTKRIACDVRY